MAVCSDVPRFYALVHQACAHDPGSPACQRVVSEGVDAFGTSCLKLPIVEGASQFPPFSDYVCNRATGRLASQCGRHADASTNSQMGTGSGKGPGVGYGAAATVAASSAAVGGLAGALLSARRRATLPPHRRTEMSADDKCAVNWIMCIDTDELTFEGIKEKGNAPLTIDATVEKRVRQPDDRSHRRWLGDFVKAYDEETARTNIDAYRDLIERAQQKIDKLSPTEDVSSIVNEQVEYPLIQVQAKVHFREMHAHVKTEALAKSKELADSQRRALEEHVRASPL